MRFYRCLITNSEGTLIQEFSSLTVTGTTNPAALLLEMDIPLYTMAQPMGAGFLRFWGIGIKMISQASNFNGMNIQLFGGMAAGLPLANPKQAGLILQGTIQQAFGNWQGTEQSLDLIVNVTTGTNAAPVNLVANWKKGQPLATSIKNTLAVAFPTYTTQINISNNLVLPNDAPGYYQTVSQFAEYVRNISKQIIGGTYSGVSIVIRNNVFYVYDGTTPTTPKQINFVDLIGQPTWIDPGTINIRCVMRADIVVGDYLKLPAGTPVITTQGSYSQYRNTSVFQGSFQAVRVNMIGNSRQPDGNSWVTSIDAVIGATT